MSSRHSALVINRSHQEKYAKAVNFLREFRDMFIELKIGNRDFKSVQSGVLLSTQPILDLQEMLIGRQFFFSGHVTFHTRQPGEFFLHSVTKKSHSTPLEYKIALKIITVSQYLKSPKNGSYKIDDSVFDLADVEDVTIESAQCDKSMTSDLPNMSLVKKNGFVYYCGYVDFAVLKNSVTCETCVNAVKTRMTTSDTAKLIELKHYVPDALKCPPKYVLQILRTREGAFQRMIKKLLNANNIMTVLSKRVSEENKYLVLPSCHGIKQQIVKRYCHARLQLYLLQKSCVKWQGK